MAARPISFEQNTNLSALSWRAIDDHLSLDQIGKQFEAITRETRLPSIALTVPVGIANGCFCKLFGGDYMAALMKMFSKSTSL